MPRLNTACINLFTKPNSNTANNFNNESAAIMKLYKVSWSKYRSGNNSKVIQTHITEGWNIIRERSNGYIVLCIIEHLYSNTPASFAIPYIAVNKVHQLHCSAINEKFYVGEVFNNETSFLSLPFTWEKPFHN